MKEFKFKSGDFVTYNIGDKVYISIISQVEDDRIVELVSCRLEEKDNNWVELISYYCNVYIISLENVRYSTNEEINVILDEINYDGNYYHKMTNSIIKLDESDNINVRTPKDISCLTLSLYNEKNEFVAEITNELSLYDVLVQISKKQLSGYYLQYYTKDGEEVNVTISNKGRVKHELPFKTSLDYMLKEIVHF